ncbi:Zinc finger protein plagl2 [Entophlyctis luteolus]|nr:Zinc finger protein plagl2 [Entophlyctis luteolus]
MATAFECSVCSRPFAKRSRLRQHELSHTGIRPFACSHPDCDKAYSRKAHLDIHIRSHSTSDEVRKPFRCTWGSTAQTGAASVDADPIGDDPETHDVDDVDDGGSTSCDDEGDAATSTVSRLVRDSSDSTACTARFSTLHHLKRHMKSHSDPLPHKQYNCASTKVAILASYRINARTINARAASLHIPACSSMHALVFIRLKSSICAETSDAEFLLQNGAYFKRM